MTWEEKTKNEILKQVEGMKSKDILFFRIEEFWRNLERIESNSAACPECNQLLVKAEDIIPSIKMVVQSPGKVRKKFDQIQDELANHLTKKHQYYRAWHFTYRIGLAYLVCGTSIGLLFDWIHSNYNLFIFTITFGVLGLLIGNIIGSKKDAQTRRNGKQM